jgi:hypothetical protein
MAVLSGGLVACYLTFVLKLFMTFKNDLEQQLHPHTTLLIVRA